MAWVTRDWSVDSATSAPCSETRSGYFSKCAVSISIFSTTTGGRFQDQPIVAGLAAAAGFPAVSHVDAAARLDDAGGHAEWVLL